MRVVVTGSSGKVGRAAVHALSAAGHRVVGLDLRPSPDGAPTVAVDCTDFGQVLGALSGVDAVMRRVQAVVHLAGIPAPGLAPDHTVFQANALSTHHVFSACARLGIDRVVWSSSETILGLPFTEPPLFLPLDETAPDRPAFAYALAKQVGESMADAFVSWYPSLSIASLRLSNVFGVDDRAGLAAIHGDPGLRRSNLWGYVDAVDAGRACALAVDASLSGHERMIIAAADTITDVPSSELRAAHFPDVPVRGSLDGHVSLLSSARAGALIGYQPTVSWRDWPRP